MASADAGTLVRQVRKFQEKIAMAYSKNLTIIAGTALAYFPVSYTHLTLPTNREV